MLTRLRQFNQLCARFNQARSLSELSKAIMECLKNMESCARGCVWLRNYNSEELELMAAFGYNDNRPIPQVHNAYNTLCAPLCYQEQILGYLQAETADGQMFDELSQELFSTLATQAAVALENARLFANVQHTYMETICSLANALEARDKYTKGHSERVTYYSLKLAAAINLDEDKMQILKYAAMLHDIGKIGIKDDILNKNDRLTLEERTIIERHTLFGDLILEPCKFLSGVQKIVLHHHERYDGHGYPEKLSGEEIPLESRIIAVADAYDAMTSDRPYRHALDRDTAIFEINKGSGSQFDPQLAKAFINILRNDLLHFSESSSEVKVNVA